MSSSVDRSNAATRSFRIQNLQIPSWGLTLLASIYLLAAFNGHFFSEVAMLHGVEGLQGWLFTATTVLFLGVIFNLILSLLALPYVLKPVLILLLITSSMASYFMQTYNIMIDKTMIQNVMGTDIRESLELMSLGLLTHVVLTGVLPALVVYKLPVRYRSLPRELATKVVTFAITAVTIGAIASVYYQDYASLFRNNHYIRDLVVPVNYLHAFQSYAKHSMPQEDVPLTILGTDAQLGDAWTAPEQRKVVMVLVVGETARAANFSLNGYERQTTPELASEDGLINFTNFQSCGTSTAVSVPCMFSIQGRSSFDSTDAKNSENLLDVLQHAGLTVVWRDNNSGCKDVCARVGYRSTEDTAPADLCQDGECFDMALLDGLDQDIEQSDKGIVVVLHQKGSHGPAYFLRTPEQFQKYQPLCHTNQLQECSQEEITNAYDNTILYTDHFLAQTIDFLRARSDRYDVSMLYLSDHGESLGENNLYLHGLPYMLAPEEQTHVPFLFWTDNSFSNRFALDMDCVGSESDKAFSQDHLFDSVLGLLDVQTTVYDQDRDLFHPCQGRGQQQLATSEEGQPNA